MQDALALQLATVENARDIARMSATLIERGLPHTWTTRRVSAHIRHKDSVVLVAHSGSEKSPRELIGFAIMQFAETTAHLNLLAVRPHARRSGVGRQMLSWLHESAMVAGTFLVRLELRATNIEARHFYKSMGYEEFGYVRRYYSNVEDAVRMSRDLTVRAH